MGVLASVPTTRPTPDAAFSLVEVLAVLLIIGLAAGAVVLALPPPEPTGREEARALTARFVLAAEESILAGTPTGVRVTLDGYEFTRREAGEWAPLVERAAFEPRAWGDAVSVRLVRNGAPITLETERAAVALTTETGEPAPPQIRFDPAGMATPFQLRLDHPDGVYLIAGDASGAITWTEGGAGG